jgi:hypothetical protein
VTDAASTQGSADEDGDAIVQLVWAVLSIRPSDRKPSGEAYLGSVAGATMSAVAELDERLRKLEGRKSRGLRELVFAADPALAAKISVADGEGDDGTDAP